MGGREGKHTGLSAGCAQGGGADGMLGRAGLLCLQPGGVLVGESGDGEIVGG